ncbi:ras-like protein family member 10B [Copidosoma floridanum]|uniref:ras-like protein family member 10B n=1 Tax=Copidosoma floridanum TaxID=29053 RepID=UPI0006C995F8|nr:ras-like protein family member 10B [Copidosoma floridanum]
MHARRQEKRRSETATKTSELESGLSTTTKTAAHTTSDSALLLFALSLIARADEQLNGRWMDEEQSGGSVEKSSCSGSSNDTPTTATLSWTTLNPSRTLLELDLDYLERRGVGDDGLESEAASGPASKDEDSPADTLERVKVIFLGASGVGKTSIIRQFVWNEFSEEYRPTEGRETYYPSVVLAERMYELKITDLPTIPYFPINSHLEWTDFRYYGLRSATAYVLVFDLSNQDTFQYIRTLREQIYEARDMRGVPLMVVGNKQDKLSTTSTTTPTARHRDIINLVRKHWRCGYVECSARYNYHVVQVFRELMKSIQSLEGKVPSPTASGSLRHQSCDSGSAGAAGNEATGGSEKCVLL